MTVGEKHDQREYGKLVGQGVADLGIVALIEEIVKDGNICCMQDMFNQW